MAIDYKKALTDPFEDPSAPVKWGIGAACVFFWWVLLLPMLALHGYICQAMRNSAEGSEEKLPSWDNFGNYIWQGTVLLGIGLILGCIPAGMMFIAFGGAIVALLSHHATGGIVTAGGLGFSGIMGLLGVILLLVLAFLGPALWARYARTGSFIEGLNLPAAVSDILRGPLDYIVILGITYGLGMVWGMASACIPFLGILVSLAGVFYTQVVMANLMGQYSRNYLGN
jgi:hypothetical protein